MGSSGHHSTIHVILSEVEGSVRCKSTFLSLGKVCGQMPSFHRPGLTKDYWVYITTSLSRRPLYTGVTDDLERRLYEHRHGNGDPEAFAFKYRAFRLMYSETYSLIEDAIGRKKQLKGWSRKKKIALWEADNPEWRDLSED